jgi:hypothetical protein
MAILPDGAFVLKLAPMVSFGQWNAAWNCAQCRFYLRMALAFAVAAACSMILW